MNTLSRLGEQLRVALNAAHKYRARLKAVNDKQGKVHVAGAGGTLTAAYEQLRNAAENTEEHLLLQNAIRRFYRQIIVARGPHLLANSADELATELTLAGYIKNDSLTSRQLKQIDQLGQQYLPLLSSLQRHRIPSEQATGWVLDVLSVGIERLLNDHTENDAFLQFAYDYFYRSIDTKKLFGKKEPADYGIALLIAVHRALLRSDKAVLRADFMARYRVDPSDTKEFIAQARRVDDLLIDKLTEKLYHIVDKQAAPQRIVKRMLNENVPVHELLPNKQQFLNAYEKQIHREYKQTGTRVRRAIVRSIIFLFITKAIIGIAIEIPYDFWAHKEIYWAPLIVNLLFPPLYMALLSLTLGLPGRANSRALLERITATLYEEGSTTLLPTTSLERSTKQAAFSISYAVFAAVLIIAISIGLIAIGFSFVHLFIFFIFLSTASFLGFRLSRLIRELEVVTTNQTGVTFVRDLLYLPFVVIGRWLNEKYSQVNVVGLVLDMLIELPLKTVLRLVRQWAAFINAKKDEI